MRVNLAISVPCEIDGTDEISPLIVTEHVGYLLHDWRDGRYCFPAEHLHLALTDCFKQAVSKAICDIEYEKYRGEFIPHFDPLTGEENGKTAKGVLTAEPLLKALHVYLYTDEIDVSINHHKEVVTCTIVGQTGE